MNNEKHLYAIPTTPKHVIEVQETMVNWTPDIIRPGDHAIVLIGEEPYTMKCTTIDRQPGQTTYYFKHALRNIAGTLMIAQTNIYPYTVVELLV